MVVLTVYRVVRVGKDGLKKVLIEFKGQWVLLHHLEMIIFPDEIEHPESWPHPQSCPTYLPDGIKEEQEHRSPIFVRGSRHMLMPQAKLVSTIQPFPLDQFYKPTTV